jgi:outer membrane protease
MILADDTRAQQSVRQWQIAPEVTQLFGHTTYTLDVSDADSRIVSELEFPIEHLLIGGRVSYAIPGPNQTAWQVDLSGRFSVGAPGGLMTDSDWEYSLGGFNGLWSYTESEPAGSFFELTGHVYRPLWHGGNWAFGITGGVRYQRIYQEIDNFTGFQLTGPNRTANEVDVTNLLAITYEATYLMPEIGLAGEFMLLPNMRVAPRITYSRVWAEDEDDHTLRKKLSVGNGWGNAVAADLAATLLLPTRQPGRDFFLSFNTSLTTLKIQGVQDQVFYEDVVEFDPVTGQHLSIPAGSGFENLPHEFSSTQFSLGVRFGLTF